MVMLHGWMDVSASFQFVVDALGADWHVYAPDWRGFGLTEWRRATATGFRTTWPISTCSSTRPGRRARSRVGHSMGGNVALLYAGARPRRVRTVVNLEGLGLHASHPDQAPGRFASGSTN